MSYAGPPEVGRSPSEYTISHDDTIRPRSGKLGDIIEGQTQYGVRVAWRMHSVEYPADEAFAAERLSVPEGYASAIVAALFTNKNRSVIANAPVEGIRLLDTSGVSHRSAPATLTSHPPMRTGPVAEEETIVGHVYFLIPRTVGIRAIQWWPVDDSAHQVLTWLR